MNATGCVTALGDGGEAFVVLLSDDDNGRRHSRRQRQSDHPQLPPLPPLLATADPYKSRPRRKDRGAFVVLPEPPAATAPSSVPTSSSQPTGCSGRVSPFRGHGFRTPENGRSRASSPSSEPLRRQSSEPRIVAGSQQPTATKQRLSVSTKDLSATGKPPSVPSVKSSPRRKPGRSGPPTPRKPSPASPSPQVSPRTPRRSQPRTAAKPAVAAKPTVAAKQAVVAKPVVAAKPAVSIKPTVAAKPTTGANRTGVAAVNRSQPAVRSSPRMSKKYPAVATVASNKSDHTPAPKTAASTQGDLHVTATTAATTATAATTTAATTVASPSPSSYTPSTTVAPVVVPVTADTAVASVAPTSAVTVMPVTASTSATAIATAHAANAVASAVVDGGPIVTAVPPPAAIAANTLATLSVVGAGADATAKPLPSTTGSREPPAIAAIAPPKRNGCTVVSAEPVTTQRSTDKLTTTTPPLSYELEEIVVKPETENQCGRTPARLSVGRGCTDGNTTPSTTTSSNGHKTVAWARQSEKIIVATEVPNRAAEATASTAKDPAYKRFARKLCGGDGGSGGGGGDRRPPTTKASSTAAADGRAPERWTAVWKRRPRWCGPRCCRRKRKVAGRPDAAAAADDRRRRPQWWRRCGPCWCCGKRKKRLGPLASSSSESVGVLGISPPSTDTFCGKFKRRLCCCWGCCVVPKFFRRLCCCCCCCCPAKQPNVPEVKSTDAQRPSAFKCTGCCTNLPKLDPVFVEHSSVMKGAIPVLPIQLAWFCLFCNVFFPGLGTFFSGILCLCVGKPRFTINDNLQSRIGSFFVNMFVAAAQLFTVLFCLVGWGWSIWWGVIIMRMSRKNQKNKFSEHLIEAPMVLNQNHRI